ncbi:MAG: PhnD/SsuA/transferrin family substrate-binding protein [Proteobacteria bacterium]|nr:PhnD/SsuA/transferrin family substrate-binding protein [Pseudomonadota bacterium]
MSHVRIKAILLTLSTFFYISNVMSDNHFIFSAPPRGGIEAESKIYEPVARYLSKTLGKTVTYQHPGDWLSYQANMQKGAYDLIFDGPHFASWRMKRIKHEPLVTLPGKLIFNVFIRSDQKQISSIMKLAGREICGMAPPNLATLTVYDAFSDQPMRQPLIRQVKSFKSGYQQVDDGKCTAGIARDKLYKKLNKNKHMRVVYTSKGVANQGFTAGPRFTTKEKSMIIKALVNPESHKPLKGFHKRFNKSFALLRRAQVMEYAGLDRMLENSWGFR